MKTKPEAVLFDFDGTLVHIAIDFQAMRSNAVAVIRRYGEQPDDGSYTLELIGATRDKLAKKDTALADTFHREALASIEEVELTAADKAEPLPNVASTLARLRESGVAIGIVTRNCRNAVCRVLQRHDLPCEVLVTRDDVTHVKPNPEHPLQALRHLGATPAASIMVGDHPTDVEAAHAAGMIAVGLTTTRAAHEFEQQPDFIIGDVGDLVDIIENEVWLQAAPRSEER